MFSVGIVGLPNVGKSTLFKALTKIKVPIANYPFTTIDPHRGIVALKDKRLERINKILNPQKTNPPLIEFIDIAGLVKGAHKGEGLGNQFLSNITEADILLEIIKNFSILPQKEKPSKDTQYQLWEQPNPKRDIQIIKEEILKRDQKIILGAIKKTEKKDKEEKEILTLLLKKIKKETWLFDFFKELSKEKKQTYQEITKKIGLISSKPIIYLLNTIDPKNESPTNPQSSLLLNIKAEEEICELTREEKEELKVKSHLDDIVLTCYNKLDLITLYTIKGGAETRAVEIKKGTLAIDAAEKIHSDFKEKFILAEVLNFEDFVKLGSWSLAKEKGLLQKKGKDYIVQDGDIIEFKI